MDKFFKLKEYYESENPGKRFTITMYNILDIYKDIFSKVSKGQLPCIESVDGYIHIISTQKLVTYFPMLKVRSANYLQISKYGKLGFIEIQKIDGNSWFKPTALFLRYFK